MGVELLAALPFEHDISIADGAVNGKTQHLPPTLTLQYYPLGGTQARVQPYIGAGVIHPLLQRKNRCRRLA